MILKDIYIFYLNKHAGDCIKEDQFLKVKLVNTVTMVLDQNPTNFLTYGSMHRLILYPNNYNFTRFRFNRKTVITISIIAAAR
jgi:hypothetical protein